MVMSFVFKPNGTSSLTIRFNHLIGNKPLVLDTVHYRNALHQDFTVTKLKYYVGQFRLIGKNGTTYKSKSYFLIDEENPETKDISLEGIEDGEYTEVRFMLGVDSLDNCSGAQSGALDPINAMFWTWNSGYIFLKFEGKAPLSDAPGHMFEYHIGGYRHPVNCIRNIQLPLQHPLTLYKGQVSSVQINTNLLELLEHPLNIDFRTLSSVTDSKNAVSIANNYSDMFSILVP